MGGGITAIFATTVTQVVALCGAGRHFELCIEDGKHAFQFDVGLAGEYARGAQSVGPNLAAARRRCGIAVAGPGCRDHATIARIDAGRPRSGLAPA